MAREARFTSQFAVVGTDDQGEIIKRVSEIVKDDKAPVVRWMVDQVAGLENGELRPGDTVEAAAQRIAARFRPAMADAEAEPVVIV